MSYQDRHPYFLTVLGVGRRENPFTKGFYPAVVLAGLRNENELVSCLTVKYDKTMWESFKNENKWGVQL